MTQKKIVDYKIEYEESISDFEIGVLQMIEDGYIPIGGVSVTEAFIDNKYVSFYHQAMVKYED